MPPKKTPSTDEDDTVNALTTTELRFIKAVFDNMTQKPDANWDNVARDLKLKNAKCAKERFRQMSVRHGWREQQQPSTPRKEKPSSASASVSAEGRVQKIRTPRKKSVMREEEVVKDEESDEDNGVKTDADVIDEDGMQTDFDTIGGDGMRTDAEAVDDEI
ncbi:hypothetical protein L249_2364 [Ophiocordyceps polyrhachis-furcata BCC 54312]|uniref:Myb-like domain-containing protein n=1 Tax=Ophiocordyceps polyrhachis-furcata BCC 54312 TaxID=1330021 RepID=A0A367LRV4_9HYPO|nr:hypothetical protein L249_2364 [Ophiocordyceps polyrhachis-furcata BCC 54312]